LSPTDRKPRGAAPHPKALAVALRHRPNAPDAPRVVASGRGFAAEAILQLAFANGVKVREDSDLAEMLMAVGIGQEIPFAAFSAVAEILSYIYRVSQAASGAEASPSPEVPSP
jgi:flagellar biosynthesis protein